MDDAELKTLLAGELERAIGRDGDELSQERVTALKYYRGDPFGDEEEGHSQVVSRDVAEAVDSIMPSLMRIFASGDEVVSFQPNGPEDEQASAQATDYTNLVFLKDNDGFTVMHDWFKSALLYRLGVVKAWWEKEDETTTAQYRGLDDAQYEALATDPNVDVVEHAVYQLEGGLGAAHNIKVRRTSETGCVKVCAVPPEEFLVEPGVARLQDAGFMAHRCRRTVSDLIADGYDRATVERAASAGEDDWNEERIERHASEEGQRWERDAASDAMRQVWVSECYIRVDYDDDGVAELRKVTALGDSVAEILDNEEVDSHPFAILTPIPMPHSIIGRSIADLTADLQRIKSAVMRQMLDNLYLSNNPRKIVVEPHVNLDDLLTSRVGGIVRAAQPGMVETLAVEFTAAASFPMIEYLDGVREQRTGVTRYNQGLDADSLNKTAKGISIIANAGQQRIELIARVFAETGVKQLFRRILELVIKYQDKPRTIRLRNKWVSIDPREWSDKMDLSINVGLGTGNKQEQLGKIMGLLQLDEKLIALQGGVNGPLLKLEHIYNKLKKVVEAADLKSVEQYYGDPGQEQQAPQQQGPDPEMVKTQAEIQAMQVKTQAEIALARERAGAEIEIKRMSAQADIEIERMKAQGQAEIARQKAASDVALKARDQDFRAANGGYSPQPKATQ